MPVSIRLGEELEERLARASKKLRVAKTEVIKRSLAAFPDQIEPGESAYELGKDLFGADDSGPTMMGSGAHGRLHPSYALARGHDAAQRVAWAVG
jgi:hypothetical protein